MSAPGKQKYKYLIFDLDDTLFDTYGTLIKPASENASQKMIEAGLNATVEQCMEAREIFFRESTRGDVFNYLLDKFGVKDDAGADRDEIKLAGRQAFYIVPLPSVLRPFNEVPQVLSQLQTKYRLFLVTSGDPDTQKQKLKALKISSFFNQVRIADIWKAEKKVTIFRDLLNQTRGSPKDFLSIGNRLDREIADAKSLGMDTCYVIHGEHKSMIPTRPEEEPDFRIRRPIDLLEICRL